ncbi:cyclic-di-AMP receptor [Carboxydochorda subterranea]|uniref:Cyclic-di-AMP receptor n=1 Tax=Carboxydichorda subterranea TaxID=3109565 RepID=A0ABZ1BVY6_9FIRM|nr:cyclic-di-AMP receptor [Limnochorda sp. L945t]WRP16962.1 cyclic-di-AMP receptor [Limnochorda sp. L945t]
MKLIIAIVDDSDSRALVDALTRARIGVTRLASTGGFLLEGNTTLMIGAEEHQVDQVLHLIRTTCVRRARLLPQPITEIPGSTPMPLEVEVGGAVVWVLQVERIERV